LEVTEFTRGTGVRGMTILGVLGEADKLTERERERVTEIGSRPPRSFPICVGTTCRNGRLRTRRAQERGARR
jgi:dihydrodipicolinate synthase/N-acetylneuraminate lyase